METVLVVLHVLTAVFLVGPMAVLPMVALRDLRTGQGTQAAALGRSTFVFSVASVIVAILGFGVLGMSDPKYDLSVATPWVLASLIMYVVALVLDLAVVVPALRRAGGSGPEESGGDYSRIAMSSGVVAVLLIAVVVLMVWKP
ncbi:MAG: DUF2269 family protein [Nocardioidaceae bacterium]